MDLAPIICKEKKPSHESTVWISNENEPFLEVAIRMEIEFFICKVQMAHRDSKDRSEALSFCYCVVTLSF